MGTSQFKSPPSETRHKQVPHKDEPLCQYPTSVSMDRILVIQSPGNGWPTRHGFQRKAGGGGSCVLLKGLDGFPSDVLTNAESLDAGLFNLFQSPDLADMGVRGIAWAKLARAMGGEAAFGVLSLTRVLAGASGEDCGLAGLDGGHGHVED